ncbi:DUF262 domain-containing HNH endonuclease family protein [Paraflavisolibacter sp. H34]|uniref:DUF262 domain-containing protein n=1 Tax=Huijunlia imazamoxiresistens TaxID=3127457 RepID=UPI0030162AEF
MKSIQEVFENALFRIPDYQRGYSWKDTHLDDFWQDLKNLREDHFHYTGALTLERPAGQNLKKWKGDEWIITSGSIKPFYIVDGQQRITTIVILLNILIERLEDEEQYLYQSKTDLIAKFIYKRNEKNKLQSFIFGYEVDDPSYEYLKTEIFKQESSEAANQPETTYTNNLMLADNFFRERLKGWGLQEKENLFKKVTQQLKFDLKIIENDLDIFVVFETMNNRGKPLTNLEKLKNRLIYLTTLMHESDYQEKNQLRKEINDVWKTCYEFLGKNKKSPQIDDIFLRNHFIVYHYFEKTKDFPNLQIFKEIYTVQNTVIEKPNVSFKVVRKYIRSLQKASQLWYAINNPKHALQYEFISEEEAYWLSKLNHLAFKAFSSLTLSVFMSTEDTCARVEFLKSMESFIFLNFHCAGRRSTLGTSNFAHKANQLYNKTDGLTVDDLIHELRDWTYGNEESYGYYTNERFVLTIKDLFSNSKKNGYYDWSGLKYLLFEYEEHLQGEEPQKVKWSTPNSIEHIFPQNDADPAWKENFKNFTPKQRKILSNSLGNLILLRGSKNSELSNKAFAFKKKHSSAKGGMNGYINGSHSEIQVAQNKDWNAKTIYKRGVSILNFLQQRWGVALTTSEIRYLLLADEVLIEKVKSI